MCATIFLPMPLRRRTKLALPFLVALFAAGVMMPAGCSGTVTGSGADPSANEGGPTGPNSDSSSGDPARDSSLPRIDSSLPDAPPGAWSPTKLPSLALWLDGSVGVTAGVGNKVSKWADQSGNGNDATQQNVALQPLLSPGINGRAGLYFDKNGSPVALNVPAPKNAPMTGDFTVMVVFQAGITGATASDLFKSELATTTSATLSLSPPQLTASVSVAGSGKFAASPQMIYGDGKPHLGGMRKTAAKLEILADGASASVLNPPAGDVGGQFIVGGQLKGNITEVVLATASVDDAALAELTAYLKKKYALP